MALLLKKRFKYIDPCAIIIDAASMRTPGTRISSSLKALCKGTPIILIVAENQEIGNSVCADEVLRLPLTLKKLINSLRPYIAMNENKQLECGPIKLDLQERWVHCNGKKTRLTPRQFSLLEMLMRHPGDLLQREEIFKTLWETDYYGDTRTLDVHISWLRRALEDDPHHPALIRTVRSVGYKLDL